MGNWVRAPKGGMIPRPQATAATCWLTCYRMMYECRGLDPATIGPKLKSGGVDIDAAVTGGLDRTDFMKAAVALGLKPWGGGQSWTTFQFKTWLAVSPVWIAGCWHPSSPHIVILTGASDDQVEFIDPWWQGVEEATVAQRFTNDFIHGDGKSARGTDFYMGQIGGVAVWT
jgi:Papain-like cysteine protease AvrRpt2